MSTMIATLGVEKLALEDQRRLFEELQRKFEPDEPGVGPLTDAQSAELDRRLADIEKNPEDWIPWDDVKEEVRRRSRP